MSGAGAAQSPFVIYSPNEAAVGDGAGFWSNEDGWVDLEQATRFEKSEIDNLNLPHATGMDAVWMPLNEVEQAVSRATAEKPA